MLLERLASHSLDQSCQQRVPGVAVAVPGARLGLQLATQDPRLGLAPGQPLEVAAVVVLRQARGVVEQLLNGDGRLVFRHRLEVPAQPGRQVELALRRQSVDRGRGEGLADRAGVEGGVDAQRHLVLALGQSVGAREDLLATALHPDHERQTFLGPGGQEGVQG